MLHACDQRFDVTENLKNFCELNKALSIYLLGSDVVILMIPLKKNFNSFIKYLDICIKY